MTRIKICGITRVSDARAAVRYGADAIGFVFAPSLRQVTIRQAAALVRVLPVHVLRFGVFVDQDPAWIAAVVDAVGLDRIQFHGQESNQTLKKFAWSRVIKALRPQPDASLPVKDPASAASAYLVDALVPGQAGGTGQLSNWRFARTLKKFGKPVILSGGLHAGNISQALIKMKPYMVDVSSGVEIRPGIKNHAKMKQLIQMVKA
ncbi:phosphoribosylanthranilate isomerase [bacterium]|nr:phosphoribosylanthranilate isomerase [bacterium]